jgi:hypothetical protein
MSIVCLLVPKPPRSIVGLPQTPIILRLTAPGALRKIKARQ